MDGCFFAFSGAAAIWLAYLLVRDGVRAGWPSLLLLVFWVFFTYLVLPRLHRILTEIYVPGYFIGRTRTSDGLLGDPVNLALHGGEGQVHRALTAAGWIRADDLDFSAGRRIALERRGSSQLPRGTGQPAAPVRPPAGLRLPAGGRGQPVPPPPRAVLALPGGLAAPRRVRGGLAGGRRPSTRRSGLSLFTLQITHKIEENTDVERDFLVRSITGAVPEVGVEVIENFSSGYHARNGGGDRIRTDGNLPILDLRGVATTPIEQPAAPTDSRDRRPASTTTGSALTLLRALAYVVLAALALASADGTGILEGTGVDRDQLEVFAYSVAAVGIAAAVFDAVLALTVFRGSNWARLLLMGACTVTATTAFAATVGSDGRPVGYASLPTLSASILVLLALSSRSARQYATRTRV